MLKETAQKFGTNAGKYNTKVSQPLQAKQNNRILIVVLPCMLTITQLLLQQNAHFYY
jgi:hypothetical protein